MDFREWTARNRSRHDLLDEDVVDPSIESHMNLAAARAEAAAAKNAAKKTKDKKRDRSKIHCLEATLRAMRVGGSGHIW